MPEPLEINALNHIARPTRRLEEAKRFWIEVMGAREITRPPFGFGGAWLYLPGVQIHLIEHEGKTIADPADSIDTRGRHCAFWVTDIDAMEERLREQGIAYERKAMPERNWPQIFFQDPDGHVIEIGMYGQQDV
jgi:glyoxylase I family protein